MFGELAKHEVIGPGIIGSVAPRCSASTSRHTPGKTRYDDCYPASAQIEKTAAMTSLDGPPNVYRLFAAPQPRRSQ